MLINYISEGVFKNPNQARAARAKDASLSNADKLASTVKEISNTKIKAEVDRLVMEFLDKSSAFPFSSLFAQPIGTSSDPWTLTKPVGNLAVNFINDEEQTFECVIDAGNICDRYNNNDPVKCIVGVFDPRVRGNNKSLTSTSSAEEIIEALTARNISMIKSKASKALKSKTLPASAVYTRAALDKIIKYKFVIKNIFVGVNGPLRVKNMMTPSITTNVVPDEEIKQLLFSIITFIPRSTDACIKLKSSENKEIDSGVSFALNGIDDIAKDIVNVTIRTDVEHLIQNFKLELEMLDRHDSSPNKSMTLKCKPAMKKIDKEYLAYLAKSKSITIKDVQCTYGRMTYTVIDLRTKQETEEVDESRMYGKGIKITYSLTGDTENSYIYATLSKDSWYPRWTIKNKSVFLKNNLKPTQDVEEFKHIGNPTFWNQKLANLLADAKTISDATDIALLVYYNNKLALARNGNMLNIDAFYDLDQIDKLSNGKYVDITQEDFSRVSGRLRYLLEIANKQTSKK